VNEDSDVEARILYHSNSYT